ncbi:MAG: hypothetical protein IJD21_00070 [Oscillospiraceae bacterium]|nr:hypothetical protein [Oscillospiraceae bacterium]
MTQIDPQAVARKIRSQYTTPSNPQLDALRALDRKVKRPTLILGTVLGIFSALTMGAGMSLIMTDIGSYFGLANPLLPGVAIGAAGLILALVNLVLSRAILKTRKARYAGEIVALSQELIGE